MPAPTGPTNAPMVLNTPAMPPIEPKRLSPSDSATSIGISTSGAPSDKSEYQHERNQHRGSRGAEDQNHADACGEKVAGQRDSRAHAIGEEAHPELAEGGEHVHQAHHAGRE